MTHKIQGCLLLKIPWPLPKRVCHQQPRSQCCLQLKIPQLMFMCRVCLSIKRQILQIAKIRLCPQLTNLWLLLCRVHQQQPFILQLLPRVHHHRLQPCRQHLAHQWAISLHIKCKTMHEFAIIMGKEYTPITVIKHTHIIRLAMLQHQLRPIIILPITVAVATTSQRKHSPRQTTINRKLPPRAPSNSYHNMVIMHNQNFPSD